MTYLLDTHTFLWILKTPTALPASVQDICKNRSATLLISIVTPWEMAIKCAKGKLDAAYVLDNFETLLAQGGYTMLETTIQQVIRGGRLPLHHGDPFDRLLMAQAMEEPMRFLTTDSQMKQYSELVIEV